MLKLKKAQPITWVPSGTHGIYVGMGCLSRELTDRALCDYDYALYDVSDGTQSIITDSSSPLPGVKFAREFGLSSGVAATITVEPACNFYIQNSASGASYNKMYFRYVQETEPGAAWNNETEFVLG